MNEVEKLALELYLRFGMSRRAIEGLLQLRRRNGKSAQKIIDDYSLRDERFKGRLLGCDQRQLKSALSSIAQHTHNYSGASIPPLKLQGIIDDKVPPCDLGSLRRYKGCFAVAPNATAYHYMVCGEVRNLTNRCFTRGKAIAGVCQHKDCRKQATLDTAHFGTDRPQLFVEAACESITRQRGADGVTFDVYETMRRYLRRHLRFKHRVCFLCKECHNTLHAHERAEKKARQAKIDRRNKVREARQALRSFKLCID